MSKKALHTDHYQCRLCGQSSPLTATFCSNPSCGAQLSLYGEVIEVSGRGDAAGLKRKLAGWRAFAIIMLVLFLAAGGVFGYLFYDTWERYDYLSDRYDDLNADYKDLKSEKTALESELDDLEWDYYSLESDYDDLTQTHAACEAFMENNGFDGLYTIEVISVFNANSDGERINDTLEIGVLDRLAIKVNIIAADVDNRWADPLQIELTKSGTTVASWSIAPGESRGQEDQTDSWTMWTSSVKSAGTYTAVFRHKGVIVATYEITVK